MIEKKELKIAIILSSIILVFGIVGGLFLIFKDKEFVIVLDKEKLQEKINKKFPIQDSAKFKDYEISVDIQGPEILLTEGEDRIGIFSPVKIGIKTKKHDLNIGGEIQLSSGFKYYGQERILRLYDPRLDSLKADGIPMTLKFSVNTFLKKHGGRIIDGFPIPIPEIDIAKESLKKKLMKAMLKRCYVEDGKMYVILEY